jgi:hypothetical protein
MDFISKRILLGSAGAGGEDYWVAFYLNQYVRVEQYSIDNDNCRLAVDGLGNVAFRFKNDTTYTGGTERYNIVKFDDTGSLIFQKRFNNIDRYGDIKFDSQNNLYFSYGSIYSNPSSFAQSVGLMKISSTGTITWQIAQGNTYQNHAGGRLAFDSSDNIYVESKYNWTGNDRWGFTKFNSSGTVQATKGTTFSIQPDPNDIKIDSSDNIYVAGNTGSPYTNGTVAKLNSAFTLQWARSVSGPGETRTMYALALDGSENILQLTNGSFSSGGRPANIQKWNSSGTLQWQKSVKGNANLPNFSTGSIACDGSDNVYLGGTFNSSSNIYGVIVKLNSSGAKVWEREVFFSDSAYNLKKTRVVDIVVKKNTLYVYGVGENTGNAQILPFVLKVPTDGSLTTPTNGLTVNAQSPYLTSNMIFKYQNFSGGTTVSTATDTIATPSVNFSNVSGLSTASTTRTPTNTVGTGGVSPIIDLDDL